MATLLNPMMNFFIILGIFRGDTLVHKIGLNYFCFETFTLHSKQTNVQSPVNFSAYVQLLSPFYEVASRDASIINPTVGGIQLHYSNTEYYTNNDNTATSIIVTS